jgi:hypothetical protein
LRGITALQIHETPGVRLVQKPANTTFSFLHLKFEREKERKKRKKEERKKKKRKTEHNKNNKSILKGSDDGVLQSGKLSFGLCPSSGILKKTQRFENWIQFSKRYVFLEYQTMDRVQNLSNKKIIKITQRKNKSLFL